MAVFVIYNQTQRRRATDWLQPLIDAGWEFDLAPLGLEVGSEPWKEAVRECVENAEAGIVLVTKEAATDDSVEWRSQLVLDKGIPLIPVVLDGTRHFPRSGALSQLQYLIGDDRGRESLAGILPRIARRRPKCFVSYSREDKGFVSKLALDLRASGVKVWRDDDDIRSGATWDDAVENALREATHVLYIVSSRSTASRTVSDEVSFALEEKKVVVPCIIESTKLPMRVRRNQWIDFSNDCDASFSKLVKQLRDWSDEAA